MFRKASSYFFKSPSFSESEPFLPVLDEVIIPDEDIHIFPPKTPSPQKPALSYELKACIDILESAKRTNLPSAINLLEKWQRYQNIVWLFSFLGLLAGGGITADILWHVYESKFSQTKKEIDKLHHHLDNLDATLDKTDLAESASIVGGALIYLGILGFAIYQLAKANDEYKEDKNKLHLLENCLKDPAQTNRVINLGTRLNISLTHISIEELIEKFKQVEKALEERQKPKWMALWCFNQINHPETNEPINIVNDVRKLIFKEAGFI